MACLMHSFVNGDIVYQNWQDRAGQSFPSEREVHHFHSKVTIVVTMDDSAILDCLQF